MTSRTAEIDCTAAVQQLWDFLDEELTDDRMEAVRRHLASCSRCLPHQAFAESFLAALAATREPDRRAPEELRIRVLTTLQSAGYTPS